MSSQDQEAMRKLRLTMDMGIAMANSDSGSSSGSLQSPIRVGSSSSLGHGSGQGQGQGRPGLGSRRSTLSRQITSEDLDDPIPASVSLSQPEGYGRTDPRMSRIPTPIPILISIPPRNPNRILSLP